MIQSVCSLGEGGGGGESPKTEGRNFFLFNFLFLKGTKVIKVRHPFKTFIFESISRFVDILMSCS